MRTFSTFKRIAAVSLALGTVSALAIVPAFSVTNTRTCAQVQKEFAQKGRVTTRTRSGATLPIYGGVPYLIKKSIRCGPRSAVYKQYVITSDKSRCPVSQRCV